MARGMTPETRGGQRDLLWGLVRKRVRRCEGRILNCRFGNAPSRAPVQIREYFLELFFEPLKQRTAINRNVGGAFVKVGGERVDELAVLEQRIMKMRAGRQPGAADISNDLSEPHRRPLLNLWTDCG